MTSPIPQRIYYPTRQIDYNIKQRQYTNRFKGTHEGQRDSNNTVVSTMIQSSWKSQHFQDLQTTRGQSKKHRNNLTLDDSTCENPTYKKNPVTINKVINQERLNKTAKLGPFNPFQQILNQNETAQFNINFPFGEQYSKIEVKSPTFSDIFNSSQCKSPQFNIDKGMYFLSPRKNCGQVEIRNQIKIQGKLCKEQNKVAKSDNRHILNQIYDIKIPQLPHSANKLQFGDKTAQYSKISSGYKLKNHFNPSTTKIKNIPYRFQQQVTNPSNEQERYNPFSTKMSSYSSLSNPQQQPHQQKPINQTLIYTQNRLFCRNRQIVQLNKNIQQIKPKSNTPQSINKSINFRLSLKKLQLKEQLEQIYNGKFKLQKTVRF